MSEKERAHRGAVRKCITQVEQAPTTSAYGYIVACNRCVVEASCRVPLQSSSSPSKSNSQRNVSIPKQSKEAQAPVEASCLAGIQSELFASDNVYTQMHTHTHTHKAILDMPVQRDMPPWILRTNASSCTTHVLPARTSKQPHTIQQRLLVASSSAAITRKLRHKWHSIGVCS